MTGSEQDDDVPAVVGVPPETPEAVRPSATGVVVGPLDEPSDVVIAEVAHEAPRGSDARGLVDEASHDQTLEDAEGGVGASTLDAPDAPDAPEDTDDTNAP